MTDQVPSTAGVTAGIAAGITTGVLAGQWRADVDAAGFVRPADGEVLEWCIAADDRWYWPSTEPTVRQQRVEGTPVVETRMRIPGGDAIQRIHSVPDHGGLTLIEVCNDSALPIAVAFTHRGLLSARPPTEVDATVAGIDLPAGSVSFPVGHRSSVTVALPHDGRSSGVLPGGLPSAEQVARGWLRLTEIAGRVALPDAVLVESVTTTRAELLLAGPHDPSDALGFLISADQLVRLGADPEPWLADAADAAGRVARGVARGVVRRPPRRRPGRSRGNREPLLRAELDWQSAGALDAAARLFAAAADGRAAADLAATRARLGPSAVPPLPGASADPTSGALMELMRMERLLADPSGRLLAGGLPSAWLGGVVEAHDLPLGSADLVSFALRWHGARPAVLWEVSAVGGGSPGAVTLSSPVVAPGWTTTDPTGEALWPAPAGNAQPSAPIDIVGGDDVSFA